MGVIHGCAHVAGLYEPDATWDNFPNTGSFLLDGFEYIRGIFGNSGAIKVFMGSAYSSQFYTFDTWAGSPGNLSALAVESQFSTLFGDPNFKHYIIDAFTFNDGGADLWKFGLRDQTSYLNNEYSEMFNFASDLLLTYNGQGKTFVIQDQEGDWSLISADSISDTHTVTWARINMMVAWQQTRRRAIANARKATPSDCSIYYAVECNRVVDCLDNRSIRRVATKVLERIKPDFVSWSAYDGIFGLQAGESPWHSSQSSLISRMNSRLADGTALLQDLGSCPVYWGEWGFPLDEIPVGYSASTLITNVFEKAEELNIPYSLYWQVIDNEDRGFELYDNLGNITEAATTFQTLLA